MADRRRGALDVVALGNAIVDVLASTDDEFIEAQALNKGAMTLIDRDQAIALYETMGPGREISGGSAANTMAGLASFGGMAGFIGKVADDQLGRIFSHDLKATGVHFETPAAGAGSLPTGRCLVLVTPDAQRTMCTFLGISSALSPSDVDTDLIGAAQVTYLEGYLWDPDDAKDAFRKAMNVAHLAGRKVAFTLSDAFCVDRHREEFKALVEGEVDILFANEAEIMSLYEVNSFDEALQAVRGKLDAVALTRSEKGSVVLIDGEVHVVDAAPVDTVIDTTGAGDLFAAGFLRGYTTGRDMAECARLGGLAAAEVISHIGARPEIPLSTLDPGPDA